MHRHGHTVDQVIQRPDDGIHRSTEVSEALESDHMCVITQLDVTVTPSAPIYRVVRNLRAVNRASFNEDFQADLGNLTDSTADQLNAILRTVLDKHAPASRRRVSTGKPSPWFSLLGFDLLAAKRERLQAERPWRSTGFTVNRDLYRKAKQFVTTLVQKAKSLFYNTKITEAKFTKELYHITNSISARTKCTQLPTIFPLSDLPNLFSEFFQHKVSKIRSDLDSQTCASHPLGKPFSSEPFLSFTPVSK